jgi:hypothetical protein
LSSLDSLLPKYRAGKIDDVYDYYDESGAVSVLNVDCPEIDIDIDLDMGAANPHDTDFENVKRLYGGLKDLPPNIAAKQDFWGWYAHAWQGEYVLYRSEVQKKEYDESSVFRDFFCRSKPQRGGKSTKVEPPRRMLVVNLLSRLWWTGRLMYDTENEDPYHFVRLFTRSAYNSNIVLLASSTASSNHELLMGLLDAVETYTADHGNGKLRRKYFVPCTKYLNSIGAVRMIDTLSRNEIKELCLNALGQGDETAEDDETEENDE